MYRGTRMSGARVLITGGGSGIGRLMALEASRRGAEVTIWDLDATAAASVRDEIRATGGEASATTVDVADRASVSAAARGAGAVDVLINNAGVVTGRPLLEATDDAIERTFDVNVLALYWTTRALLPGMLDRGRGTVVTIASAAGLVGVAKQTDYSASKWAAIGFTESLRHELRAQGSSVGTLVVCPYYIDTGMFDGVTTKFPRLLPILKEGDVSRRIIDAIERGQQQLIMPWLARLLAPSRILPLRAFDRLVDYFGINRTMDHFVGRPRRD